LQSGYGSEHAVMHETCQGGAQYKLLFKKRF
jgi:hypothetical protein